MAEKLFHADTQTGGQTDKHNNAYIPFSKVILHCNETWNFSRDIQKFTKQFSFMWTNVCTVTVPQQRTHPGTASERT